MYENVNFCPWKLSHDFALLPFPYAWDLIPPHNWLVPLFKWKSLCKYPRYLLTHVDLPVLDQHLLPDDLAHDLHADAKQVGEWGVRVVEAVQQNLRHLSLLSRYQPERIRNFSLKECLNGIFFFSLPYSLLSCLLNFIQHTTSPSNPEIFDWDILQNHWGYNFSHKVT